MTLRLPETPNTVSAPIAPDVDQLLDAGLAATPVSPSLADPAIPGAELLTPEESEVLAELMNDPMIGSILRKLFSASSSADIGPLGNEIPPLPLPDASVL